MKSNELELLIKPIISRSIPRRSKHGFYFLKNTKLSKLVHLIFRTCQPWTILSMFLKFSMDNNLLFTNFRETQHFFNPYNIYLYAPLFFV